MEYINVHIILINSNNLHGFDGHEKLVDSFICDDEANYKKNIFLSFDSVLKLKTLITETCRSIH